LASYASSSYSPEFDDFDPISHLAGHFPPFFPSSRLSSPRSPHPSNFDPSWTPRSSSEVRWQRRRRKRKRRFTRESRFSTIEEERDKFGFGSSIRKHERPHFDDELARDFGVEITFAFSHFASDPSFKHLDYSFSKILAPIRDCSTSDSFDPEPISPTFVDPPRVIPVRY
jgi:hypothetical protein